MKKVVFVLNILFLLCCALNAQVTIGADREPDPDAVLDLAGGNKGLLLPRVYLENPHDPAPLNGHVQGMAVYNTHAVKDSLIVGLYTNDGTQWIKVRPEKYIVPEWFYMPSIPIPVAKEGEGDVDLWEEYKKQFGNTVGDEDGIISSDEENAPRPMVQLHGANELYYYVIGHDKTVFKNVSISSDGKLHYEIDADSLANVSDSTYMNIVLVVK
jgi:hypothetical protein